MRTKPIFSRIKIKISKRIINQHHVFPVRVKGVQPQKLFIERLLPLIKISSPFLSIIGVLFVRFEYSSGDGNFD